MWKRIPDQYKDAMMKVAKDLSDSLYADTLNLEQEAIQTMKENGLQLNPVPPDALEKWRAVSDKGMSELIGKAFSKDIYEEMLNHLNEYRKLNDQK